MGQISPRQFILGVGQAALEDVHPNKVQIRVEARGIGLINSECQGALSESALCGWKAGAKG